MGRMDWCEVSERPISCTGDEVRAIFAGVLHELRRAVRPQPTTPAPLMLAAAVATVLVLLLSPTPAPPIVADAAPLAQPVGTVCAADDLTLSCPAQLDAAQLDAILAGYGSPAVGSGAAWIAEGAAAGINPEIALAFFVHESSAATAPGWAGWKSDGSSTHNVGNIICAGYATCWRRFRDYATWDEGIADWYRLIAVEYIAGRGHRTVDDVIPVYAPSFENDVSGYIGAVRALVQQWRGQ